MRPVLYYRIALVGGGLFGVSGFAEFLPNLDAACAVVDITEVVVGPLVSLGHLGSVSIVECHKTMVSLTHILSN